MTDIIKEELAHILVQMLQNKNKVKQIVQPLPYSQCRKPGGLGFFRSCHSVQDWVKN